MTLIAANQTAKPEGTYDRAEAYYDRMQTLPEGMRNSRNWAICKRDGTPVSEGPEGCETFEKAYAHLVYEQVTARNTDIYPNGIMYCFGGVSNSSPYAGVSYTNVLDPVTHELLPDPETQPELYNEILILASGNTALISSSGTGLLLFLEKRDDWPEFTILTDKEIGREIMSSEGQVIITGEQWIPTEITGHPTPEGRDIAYSSLVCTVKSLIGTQQTKGAGETDEVLWDMATDPRALKLITAHDDKERFDTDLFVKAKDKTPVLLSWAQQLHKMRWDSDEALDILLSIPCVGAYYMQTEGDPEHKAWENVAREIEKVWTAKSSTGTHLQAMAAVVSTQPTDLIIPQDLIKIEIGRELAGNEDQLTGDAEKEETVLLIGGQTIEEQADFSKKIIEKCKEMWDSPDTIGKIVEFVQTCHQGDTTAIKIVLLAIMQHRIQTINEMTYISINAGSGGGKSDIVQSITSILPPDDFILGSASAKFIPRKGEKWDGKIIIYDDQQPDPQNIEYIKICNGACKGKRPVYYVLEPGNKNEPTEYPLPLRLCYIIARVDTSWGADAEQVQNRMLTVYLDESSAHKALSRKRMAKRMTINYVDTYRREAEIMRTHLWANLPDKIWVDVSHIEGHIDCQNIENRMYGHLLNMIACNAVYRQWKSTEEARSDAGGEWKEGTEHEPVMYAEKEDAEPIIDLFNMLLSADPNSADPNAGGNIHKFTKNGKRIHDAILKKYPRSPKKWESLRQMATDLNIPRESLRLGLYGRKEAKTAEALTGIILEMPGLDSEKITKYKDACEADGTTKRSQPFYPITWDPEEYHRQPQTVIKWIDDEQQQGTT